MNWKKQFDEKFLAFNDPDIVDGFAKDEIINFISSLLQQKDQEWKEKIGVWANKNYAFERTNDGGATRVIKVNDLTNFLNKQL